MVALDDQNLPALQLAVLSNLIARPTAHIFQDGGRFGHNIAFEHNPGIEVWGVNRC